MTISQSADAGLLNLQGRLHLQSRSIAALQIVLCSLLIALCAQIRIPLFFTPVPITLQTLAVMLVGGMLGSRKGAMCLLLYVLEALCGLPVLSGGASNPLVLLSPVGGYVLGFIAQAYVAGWFVERTHTLGRSMMLAGLALACSVQMACGACWLAFFIGINNVLSLGVIPFIPGELLKIAAAGAFFKRHLK